MNNKIMNYIKYNINILGFRLLPFPKIDFTASISSAKR